MNGFVIMRGSQYVARPGCERSYTAKLQEARLFEKREHAERECCGNERILTIAEAMGVR